MTEETVIEPVNSIRVARLEDDSYRLLPHRFNNVEDALDYITITRGQKFQVLSEHTVFTILQTVTSSHKRGCRAGKLGDGTSLGHLPEDPHAKITWCLKCGYKIRVDQTSGMATLATPLERRKTG